MTEKERLELAELLFPNITKTREDYEKMYPERDLPEGAMVTRYGPSPTGSVHLGNLLSAFADMVYAKQTNGSFYLRIEDTDQKRMIDGGIENITSVLHDFDILPNEGYSFDGNYGPYQQSKRTEIYQTYIKDLIKQGLAYPCFMTEEEQNNIKEEQSINKVKIGIYGMYAVDRDLSLEEVKEKLANGEEYVIRLKSPGNANKQIEVVDCIKGKMKFPEHDIDTVLLKKDGTPTYHFAHAIDDHLMHTTHVIRGDEWVSSLPLHIQLFEVLGFKPVKYAHIAPITIKDQETGNIRKISKRKDPWFGVKYYDENGIPIEALHLYLATITNTNFEEWYLNNTDKDISEFEFSFDKQAIGGTSFDEAKLVNLCKTYFSRKSGEEVYNETYCWALKHDEEYAKLLEENKDFMIQFFNIEKDGPRPRKDIAKYSDVKEEFSYAIDSIFKKENYSKYDGDKTYDVELIKEYVEQIDLSVTNEEWFNKTKEFAIEHGYAGSPKEYKKAPEEYKGHVGDICEALRVMITGRTKSPDLFSIMKILGKDRINNRIEQYKEYSNQ
ncbi:MAG: glutamate--tRNA ligase [Candidatus Faecimonas sp.]|nr:glutamate--tRNA ligase [Mycoplasmatota bacterium]MDY2908516.1 glutamate--tRNA ligase [Candidatus Faecimonas sp.]